MFQSNPTVGALRELTITGGLSERERRKRARFFDTVDVPAGTVLISQGHRNHHAYLVVDGEVAVRIDGETVATLGPDSIVGERTALTRALRANATVVTTKPSTVLAVEHRALVALANDEGTVSNALHDVLSQREAA